MYCHRFCSSSATAASLPGSVAGIALPERGNGAWPAFARRSDTTIPSSAFLRFCDAEGSASDPFPSLCRFLSAMASQTDAMARAFLCCVTFASVAATRTTALRIKLRASGRAIQLSHSWSPLKEPCCNFHFWNMPPVSLALHLLHVHRPLAFRQHSKHSLAPSRACFHPPTEKLFFPFLALQPLHSRVSSHVLQTR